MGDDLLLVLTTAGCVGTWTYAVTRAVICKRLWLDFFTLQPMPKERSDG